MLTRISVIPLSFLMFAACGTTDEDVPIDAGSDTVSDSATDTPSDTATDTATDTPSDSSPDSGVCPGPDPSENCFDVPCPEGQACVEVPGGCAPSSCACTEDGWTCTAGRSGLPCRAADRRDLLRRRAELRVGHGVLLR